MLIRFDCMARRYATNLAIALLTIVIAAVIATLVLHRLVARDARAVAAKITSIPPATAPATAPATRPAPPPQPQDLLGLLRADDPHYPTTQELDFPAGYDQAAHLVLHQPVYLCPL